MEITQLKEKIIKRIEGIQDANILVSLDVILESSDETINKFLAFTAEQTVNENENETENYNDYIKEWAKSM